MGGEMIPRVGLYARVSTSNHHQDPEAQLRDMRMDCSQRSWRVTDEYVDLGFSGTKSKRPALDRLMADARAHKFDVVMVWKFDRFARSATHLLATLEELQQLGISFVSMTDKFDASTPTGKLIFTVLAAVAEMERNLTVERVRSGLRLAVAKGKKLGRRRCQLDHETVRRAIEENGGSIYKAAAALNISYGVAWTLYKRPHRMVGTSTKV
jgi:DNA invertase Pin-like site-specific DNA recombinase